MTLRTHAFAKDDPEHSVDPAAYFGTDQTHHDTIAQQILGSVPAVQSAAIDFGADERSFWRFPGPREAASSESECDSPRQLSEEEAFNDAIYVGETEDESDAEDDED